jgi:hypothetical protein
MRHESKQLPIEQARAQMKKAYARQSVIEQAQVPVQAHCAQGLNHGFLTHAARLPQAADGMASACAWLRQIQSASAAGAHQNKPNRHEA